MTLALVTTGMSEADIATAIGCSQPTVHRIKCGSETSYSNGKALELLYDRLPIRKESNVEGEVPGHGLN